MTAMRSVSFLRSSSAPLTMVSPVGRGRGDEQDRELVDRERHELGRHRDSLELALRDPEVGHRLGADTALIAQLDRRAHLAQDREQTRARRVDADVLDQQSVARAETARDEEEGRGAEVGRERALRSRVGWRVRSA